MTHQGFRRYFANTSWMFAEQILRIVAGLFVGIYVARYLGPEKFGIFSYAIAFAAIFSGIAKLGLDGIVVRNLVNEPNMKDIYLGTAFWLKLSGAIVTLAVIAFATQFTSNDSITNLYIFIIASGTIFHSFEVVDFYFQSKVLSKFVSICKLIQLTISSILKLYLIFTGADLIWFVLVALVDQITLSLALYIAYRYKNTGWFYQYFNLKVAIRLLKDSWPLIFSSLVVLVNMRVDQIMIKELIGDYGVGIYSVAIRISELWYFIPMIITNSLSPSISSAKKISEELYHYRLQRLFTLMLWMAIGIALPMTFLSDWLVALLFGDAFSDAGGVLMIHIWIGLIVFTGCAWSKWFLNENKMKVYATFSVITLILNIILNIILIPKFGIYGAAVATLLAASIGNILVPIFMKSQRIVLLMLLNSLIPIYLVKGRVK